MLDWDDLRFFLAIARTGKLAAAGEQLRVTVSTVSRRLASMQERFGVVLFLRSQDGYDLTSAGQSILRHVERVEAEAKSVEHALAGYDSRLNGVVKVACPQILASHLLAPSFSALHSSHPGIKIEASTGDGEKELSDGAVDVVLQLREFTKPTVVARKLATIEMGVYGCISYLATHGEPQQGMELSGHRFIGCLTPEPEQEAWLANHGARASIIMDTDSFETRFWAVYSGAGLAVLPRFVADRQPVLKLVDNVADPPAIKVWQGVQTEKRLVTRVRLVLDCIADAAKSRASLLSGRELDGEPPFPETSI